jgi:hypothetical protein
MRYTARTFADHNLVATYPSPADARDAMVRLERRGIEAGDIELFGPGLRMADMPVTNDEQRDADIAVIGTVERRAVIGVVMGAILGAALGIGAAAVLSGDAGPLVGGAGGGALVGAVLGFLYAGYSGLPVNDQWQETFQDDSGTTSVAVHSTDEHEIEVALAALRDTHALRLATCGRDGRLRDVA